VNEDMMEKSQHQVNASKTTNLGKLACEYTIVLRKIIDIHGNHHKLMMALA
jgi:hypothetical protein